MRKAKRLPFEALAPYLLELPAEPVPFDWQAVFQNTHPVEIDIGFGKGPFLVTASQLNPTVNYIGVEVDGGLRLYVATRLAIRSIRNVRLAKADALRFLRDYVPPASVQAIHVYFPDPWWKRRHRKRRLFTGEFVRECDRVLRPGGQLLLATDVEEYFGVMTKLMNEATALKPMPSTEADAAQTNFERKAREQGRAVWRASYVRLPG